MAHDAAGETAATAATAARAPATANVANVATVASASTAVTATDAASAATAATCRTRAGHRERREGRQCVNCCNGRGCGDRDERGARAGGRGGRQRAAGGVRRGDDTTWVYPNGSGTRVVAVSQGERVAVQLPVVDGTIYTGAQVVHGDRRALPVGSSIDAATGIFYWQPGPGFLGRFDLALTPVSHAVSRADGSGALAAAAGG